MKACGNGALNNIHRCQDKRCKFQFDFFPSDKFFSSVTKRVYDIVIPPATSFLNCHSANTVYLITCNKCYLQYVGETAQKLNERFNGHKTGFRHPNKHGHCKILSDHFSKGICSGSSYKMQIIEKLEDNGRTERWALDARERTYRKSRETYWMKELRTVYPYGLNDLTGEEFRISKDNDLVGTSFSSLKS